MLKRPFRGIWLGRIQIDRQYSPCHILDWADIVAA